ncbi:unnamed protein product [Leuciscus chuanchicus]
MYQKLPTSGKHLKIKESSRGALIIRLEKYIPGRLNILTTRNAFGEWTKKHFEQTAKTSCLRQGVAASRPPTPIRTEDQLRSTGLSFPNHTGGAAAIICHTGGGPQNKTGGEKEDKGKRRKRGGPNVKWRFETGNLSNLAVEHSSVQ